jgi:hypothetical protein
VENVIGTKGFAHVQRKASHSLLTALNLLQKEFPRTDKKLYFIARGVQHLDQFFQTSNIVRVGGIH